MIGFIYQTLAKIGFTHPHHPLFKHSKIAIAMYLIFVLSVVGLGYIGGESVYAAKTASASESEGAVAEGEKVFQQNCAACHLADSTTRRVGPGLKGLFKNPKLPASGKPTSEKAVREIIIDGGRQMPPLKYLKQEDVTAVIDYLKSL